MGIFLVAFQLTFRKEKANLYVTEPDSLKCCLAGSHVGFANLGLYSGSGKALGGSIPPPPHSIQNRRSFFLPFLPAAGAYCQLPGVVVWSERLPGV